MKKTTILLTASCLLLGAAVSQAASILRITEVMSNGDTSDWFELTNFGDTAASITNFRMDDSSFLVGSSVALNGIISIAPGESVIFTEGVAGDATTLRTNWSLTAAVQIGTYSGGGVGLSSGGDGVTVFADGTELTGPFAGLVRVSFGTSAPGTSFQWNYDPSGAFLTTGPTVSGTTWTNGTTSMLGTPGSVIPEPSALLLGGLGALGLFGRRRRA